AGWLKVPINGLFNNGSRESGCAGVRMVSIISCTSDSPGSMDALRPCSGLALSPNPSIRPFVLFPHTPLARDAWRLETLSPLWALVAHCHASPMSRTANLGSTHPLDPNQPHSLALPAFAQGELWACTCPRGVVGWGSLARLAAASRRPPSLVRAAQSLGLQGRKR